VRIVFGFVVMLLLAGIGRGQTMASFPTEDGGMIYADVYGQGERGLVLAHGWRFNKESWSKQAREFAAAGFRVVAIDFRG
jgi:pimeloyl-ACP methyl ester carboxylesterase